MNKAKTKALEYILTAIEKENDSRTDGTGMSHDDTNEKLNDILADCGLDLLDDESMIYEVLGIDNFHKIKDAEGCIY